MQKKFLICQKFIIIFFYCLISFEAFSFEKFNLNDIDPSENIIVEELYEPLKVTGDAIPWQLFGKLRKLKIAQLIKMVLIIVL